MSIQVHDTTSFIVTMVDQSGVAEDISQSLEKYIKLKSAKGGVVTEYAADFVTDGTDGKLTYTATPTDLDQFGDWSIQSRVVLSAAQWSSTVGEFRVECNL